MSFHLLNANPFRPEGNPYIYNIFKYILSAYYSCRTAVSVVASSRLVGAECVGCHDDGPTLGPQVGFLDHR